MEQNRSKGHQKVIKRSSPDRHREGHRAKSIKRCSNGHQKAIANSQKTHQTRAQSRPGSPPAGVANSPCGMTRPRVLGASPAFRPKPNNHDFVIKVATSPVARQAASSPVLAALFPSDPAAPLATRPRPGDRSPASTARAHRSHAGYTQAGLRHPMPNRRPCDADQQLVYGDTPARGRRLRLPRCRCARRRPAGQRRGGVWPTVSAHRVYCIAIAMAFRRSRSVSCG